MKFRIVHLAVAAVLVLTGCAAGVQFPSYTDPNSEPVNVTGLLFKPMGEGVYPAVVLLHTCGGLKPHVTEDWPGYLTGLGYVVLSVDSYGPRGFSRCTDIPGGDIYQARDAYGALDYLAGLPFVDGDRVGVMGFSIGAVTINRHMVNRDLQRSVSKGQDVIAQIAAHEARIGARAGGEIGSKIKQDGRDFKAAVAFYGRCGEIGDYTKNSVPLMEIVAENDERHAPSCIDAGERFPMIRVHVIKGAYHAFDASSASGRTDAFGSIMIYSAGAVTESEKHVKSFLSKHLGK